MTTTAPRIDDAHTALWCAKAIVDVLIDCKQVDENSAVPGALHAVLHHIHQAQQALNGKSVDH